MTAIRKAIPNDNSGIRCNQNKNLGLLYIGGNKFTSMIDLSQNTQLQSFSCFGLGLEHLDLSHLKELTELLCFDNKLSQLDLSQTPNLSSLICFGNQLTELDFTNNKYLSNLYCFTNDIKNEGMQKLVNTIPTINLEVATSNFLFMVNSLNKGTENVCTTKDVEALQAKNWEVLDICVAPDSVLTGHADPKPYAGSPAAIGSVIQNSQTLIATPNPARDYTDLTGASGEVLLFDANGRLLQRIFALAQIPQRLHLQQYPTGIYFLVHRGKTTKLIITR